MFKFTKEEQAVVVTDYTNWLLEHLCWSATPGKMTLDEFRVHLKGNFDAIKLQQGQGSLQPERENRNGPRE